MSIANYLSTDKVLSTLTRNIIQPDDVANKSYVDSSGTGGVQNPMTSDLDAGTFNITNVDDINMNGGASDLTQVGTIEVGTMEALNGTFIRCDHRFDVDNNRISSLDTPINNDDAATKGYVDGENDAFETGCGNALIQISSGGVGVFAGTTPASAEPVAKVIFNLLGMTWLTNGMQVRLDLQFSGNISNINTTHFLTLGTKDSDSTIAPSLAAFSHAYNTPLNDGTAALMNSAFSFCTSRNFTYVTGMNNYEVNLCGYVAPAVASQILNGDICFSYRLRKFV
tara:strand:- start:1021 stop:1866 length:846 start_codon:yes stop_codon:yes gene_type:complete